MKPDGPRIALALAALLAALAGCSRGDRAGKSSAGGSLDTLAVVTRALHHVTEDCITHGEPCLRLDMSYPILLHVPGGDTLALNRDLRRRLNSGTVDDEPPVYADPDSALRGRVQGFDQTTPNGAPWFEETIARVESFRPGLLTLSIAQAMYTGGAHPNSSLLYLNLDPGTAREVPLDSVIVPGASDSLLAAAERAFRRARGMPPDSSFLEAGFWFKEARFELTPNYGLTAGGLVLHYNSYDVAPYAWGPTHALVPWPELAGVIRREYLPATPESNAP